MLRRLSRGLFGGRTWYARWLRRGIVAVSGLLLLVVVARMVGVVRATSDVDLAVAELDRTDPRWRIADILADREEVPDDQNSVVVIVRAHAMLPKKWSVIEPTPVEPEAGPNPRAVAVPSNTLPEGVILVDHNLTEEELDKAAAGEAVDLLPSGPQPIQSDIQLRFPDCAFDEPLGPVLARELETVRDEYLPALQELRKILPLERGRYPTEVVGFVSPRLSSLFETRELAMVARMEAYRSVHWGNPFEAAENIRTMLALARSFDGDPFAISFVVRISVDSMAVTTLHRLIFQCSLPEDELLQLERLLAREEAEIAKQLARAMRTERGYQFDILDQFRTGALKPEAFQLPGTHRDRALEAGELAAGAISYPRAQAGILRGITKMLVVLDRPYAEQVAAFAAIRDEQPSTPLDKLTGDNVRTGLEAVERVAAAGYRQVCQIRCARECVLAEIFRIRFKRLPKSTEELCTSLRVPIFLDPWTDAPLLWKAVDGQVRIYSVGADGIDNGGKTTLFSMDQTGFDIGLSIPRNRATVR